jgi:hypothetical protein
MKRCIDGSFTFQAGVAIEQDAIGCVSNNIAYHAAGQHESTTA